MIQRPCELLYVFAQTRNRSNAWDETYVELQKGYSIVGELRRRSDAKSHGGAAETKHLYLAIVHVVFSSITPRIRGITSINNS